VLAYILTTPPRGVRILTLALDLNADFDQGIDGSAVERAVRELVRDGRLWMRAGRVVWVDSAGVDP
jgi:hypothetical protein